MSGAANRNAIFTKSQKVLKKHYKPVLAPSDRTVLEHMLYACCLENAMPEAADDAFAKLQESYYDWNEVRVTTITELSETMKALPDPVAAATRLKKTLQSVFENTYSFDLDLLRKQNLGKSIKELERYGVTSAFILAYLTQNALGGHSIPLCEGSLQVLYLVGAATENDVKNNKVTGLDRAIGKAKGAEYSSLLHQLGADYLAAPFSNRVRSIVIEINGDAKDRFPKRASSKTTESPSKATSKKAKKTSKKAAEKKTTKTAAKASKPAKPAKKKTTKKKTSTKRLSQKKPR